MGEVTQAAERRVVRTKRQLSVSQILIKVLYFLGLLFLLFLALASLILFAMFLVAMNRLEGEEAAESSEP